MDIRKNFKFSKILFYDEEMVLITRFRMPALSKCLATFNTTWQDYRHSLNRMAMNYPYRFSVFENYVKESIIRKIGLEYRFI